MGCRNRETRSPHPRRHPAGRAKFFIGPGHPTEVDGFDQSTAVEIGRIEDAGEFPSGDGR